MDAKTRRRAKTLIIRMRNSFNNAVNHKMVAGAVGINTELGKDYLRKYNKEWDRHFEASRELEDIISHK